MRLVPKYRFAVSKSIRQYNQQNYIEMTECGFVVVFLYLTKILFLLLVAGSENLFEWLTYKIKGSKVINDYKYILNFPY